MSRTEPRLVARVVAMLRGRRCARLALVALTMAGSAFIAAKLTSQPVVRVVLGMRDGLTCDQPIKNFGELEATELTHTFAVENRSAGKMRIARIGKSCSCLTVFVDKSVLNRGESARITVKASLERAFAGQKRRFNEEVAVSGVGQSGAQSTLILQVSGATVPTLQYATPQIVIDAPSAEIRRLRAS